MAKNQTQMLTQQAFDKAKAYIFNNGRLLDQHLFNFHFKGGNAAPVLEALAHFQNADGGFGHGLEPDIRTPASSAIATSNGFAILRQVGATEQEKMVEQAIAYCLNNYDAKEQVWEIVPPEVENAPHAPWWTYATLDFGGYVANPFASIVGYLNHYAKLAPSDFLAEITAVSLQRIQEAKITDIHDFYCYIDMAESELPMPQQKQARTQLIQAVSHLVAIDPAQWSGYNMKPLDAISAPDHFLATAVPASSIQANLDYLIAQQLSDGSWPLTWSWEQVDAAAWQQAEKDWKGHIALSNLKILHAFHRIELAE